MICVSKVLPPLCGSSLATVSRYLEIYATLYNTIQHWSLFPGDGKTNYVEYSVLKKLYLRVFRDMTGKTVLDSPPGHSRAVLNMRQSELRQVHSVKHIFMPRRLVLGAVACCLEICEQAEFQYTQCTWMPEATHKGWQYLVHVDTPYLYRSQYRVMISHLGTLNRSVQC